SLHAERLYQGTETVRNFEKAWRLQADRARGKQVPRTSTRYPHRLQYGELCKLGKHISALHTAGLTSRNLKLVFLDDLAGSPTRTVADVFRFLELPANEPVKTHHLNRRRSPLPLVPYVL